MGIAKLQAVVKRTLPPMSEKRLTFLEDLTKKGSTDALAWYGLAMEYKARGRVDDAMTAVEKLKTLHPDYVAMYLMAGEALSKAGRAPDAKAWLEAGIACAKKVGNSHALGELESALAGL
jgi:predicted Zn-dependent protease